MVPKSAACDACRKRKVKCDRSKPCSHCKRLELSCTTGWHGARPRGRMGGRGGNKDSLNVRLARLEDILSAIQQENLPLQSQLNVESSIDISQKTSINCPSTLLHSYVAGPIWSQLSEQVCWISKSSSVARMTQFLVVETDIVVHTDMTRSKVFEKF